MHLIHEGLIYGSDEDFAAGVVPVLRDAVEARQPAVAVLPPVRRDLVRERLGPAAAAEVTFHDAAHWYRTPGAAFVAWSRTLDETLAGSVECIGAVGELPLAVDVGRTDRWARYESLFNQLYGDRPARIICAYDARVLSEDGLDVCRHTHPTIATNEGRVASPEYFAGPARSTYSPVLAAAGTEASVATAAEAAEVASLRPAVVWPAYEVGLSVADAQDLVLAVTELAEAALASGGGPVTVRTRRPGSSLACEVTLAGASARSLASGRGRVALAVGSIVSDRVEVGDDENGGLVRFILSLPERGPRERILASAQELFGREGIRRTSVNAIAARANVAKATFYSHFRSKDELTRTSVRLGTEQWDLFARAEVAARAESPREQILAWFDVLAEWSERDVREESSLLRVWSELRDPNHPGRKQQAESTEGVRSYLRDLASASSADPEELSRELQLLAQGALLETVYLGSAEPVRIAATAAAKLLAATLPRE